MDWVPLLFVTLATVCDLKSREVPDSIALSLLGWSIVATSIGWHDVGYGSMLGGFAMGLGLSVIPYALGGLGGGDVKIVAALGAAIGHAAILPLLFWIAISGAALSVLALLRGRHDMAYLPAIAFGLLIFLLRQGLPGHAGSF